MNAPRALVLWALLTLLNWKTPRPGRQQRHDCEVQCPWTCYQAFMTFQLLETDIELMQTAMEEDDSSEGNRNIC